MTTIYVVVDENGEPMKGNSWKSQHSQEIRTFLTHRAARNSATQLGGYVLPVDLPSLED